MRHKDPKRIRAEEERRQASTWLEILCSGIGKQFADTTSGHYPEEIREIIRHVNTELADAVAHAERANKAYEPFWRRRRTTGRRKAKAKT
jgi:hypothetical protein